MSAVMADRPISQSFRQRKSRDTPTKKQGSSQEGASISRPAAGISGTSAQIEELLVKFDLTSKYGPCQGLSRMERWQRSKELGLDPPLEVKAAIEQLQATVGASKAQQCIWAGKV